VRQRKQSTQFLSFQVVANGRIPVRSLDHNPDKGVFQQGGIEVSSLNLSSLFWGFVGSGKFCLADIRIYPSTWRGPYEASTHRFTDIAKNDFSRPRHDKCLDCLYCNGPTYPPSWDARGLRRNSTMVRKLIFKSVFQTLCFKSKRSQYTHYYLKVKNQVVVNAWRLINPYSFRGLLADQTHIDWTRPGQSNYQLDVNHWS